MRMVEVSCIMTGHIIGMGSIRVSIHIALPVLIGIVTGPKLAVSHVILRKIYIIGNSKALYWNRIHLILIPTSIHPWL